ncbi:hypothetical protein FNF27_03000 [Cafeteria roenbergensis]|uniref:Mitotic-spindle organizing protein 1 n=1 Tax=Cafeteria roenbergensis TaxID=33653 RepID=A0A5A8DI85_CAFRO|nr:hypothetical protein FNF29_02068 [Cafeteria roenbergensis]KAA0165105.1 hypothetical protein FNF31_02118 [Cafeteria roenbergensis]KAA0170203.1 hypothetical protein FNF28_01624 [Cafeteria roenbergensis]KAA0175590.1 hypothetical protein FNF27_03000 [Cafeteria roenbergensis]|eukprot:KAA0154924.1 hypothetical protein FNF29_02068 [Cafeteria roenbergensis]
MASSDAVLHAEDAQVVDALDEMSRLLNTGLDRRSIELILALCEAGVNADALAAAINEIREQASAAPAGHPGAAARSGRER